MTIDNRQRSTEIAEEFLNRPKVVADELFDKYDIDLNRALDDATAWVLFLQRLRTTPANSIPAWPPCIPQCDTGTSDGLVLVERRVVTEELVGFTGGLDGLVRRSGLRIKRRVKQEIEKAASVD